MLSVNEVRARRPRAVVTARTLSIITAVLWAGLIGSLLATRELPSVLLLVHVVAAFGAARGRQGARITVTVTTTALLLMLLPYLWLGSDDVYHLENSVLLVVSAVLSAFAIALLYRSDGNRYFHLVTVARKSQ